jgi:hypothetical protein
MHTAPAANASSANVLSPGPLSPSQVSDKGSPASTSTTFQDVYRNVAATENGKNVDQAPGNAPTKKKSADQDTGNSAAASPASANSAVPANSILALSMSFALTPQPVANQPEAASSPSASSAESSPDPLSGASPSEKAASDKGSAASLVLSNSLSASNVLSSGVNPHGTDQKALGDSGQQAASQGESVISLPVEALLGPNTTKLNAPESSKPTDSAAAQQKQPVAAGPQVAPEISVAIDALSAPTATDPATSPQVSSIPTVRRAPSPTVPVPSSPVSSSIPVVSGASPAMTPKAGSATDGSGTPAATSSSVSSDRSSLNSSDSQVLNTVPVRSLSLSAENLAFTLQLAKTGDSSKASFDSLTGTNPPLQEGHATTSPSATTGAQPISAALAQSTLAAQASNTAAVRPALTAQPILPSAPAAPSLTPSRSQQDVVSSSGGPRIQASNDSGPRQQQDFTKSGSSQRDSGEPAKQDTTARSQLAANTQESGSAPPLNSTSNTLRQATPPTTYWLNGTAESGMRSILSGADQPTPVRPPLAASIQEIHVLPAESPKPSGTSEILLQVSDGQSSAAVRVVDRAGGVNVSVHAADQDLRTSLRANLNDLSAQLNTQGLKTDSVKTTTQSSPQGRSDQGPQDQRSGGQQHSAPQGDRQSPRGRRASALWLNELQEQTSTTANESGR